MEIDPVRLEHRLTTIEGCIATGFDAINARLDRLNASIPELKRWRYDHEQEHAVGDAQAAGRQQVRRWLDSAWAHLLAILGGSAALMALARALAS